MGLIRNTVNAAKGAVNSATGGFFGGLNGVMSQALHQEYFVSGSMAGDVLMKRAEQVRGNGSTNNSSDANVITNGSVIDVQPSQCMIIVENGKVVEACMEPGRFTYDTTLAPSFFEGEGSFGDRVKNVAKEVWEQTKMGGQRKNTQKVFFINMSVLHKAIKWGVGDVQFQHTERLAANGVPLAVGVKLKGHGTARVQLKRPLDFYEQYGAQYAGGDGAVEIKADSLEEFFESSRNHVTQSIAMAITEIGMRKPVRYNEIMTMANMAELRDMVNANVADTDLARIGFDFYEFTVGGGGLIVHDSDYEKIQELQLRATEVSDVNMANYAIQSKIAKGFEEAGKHGGTSGIFGMGMAMGGGGLGGLGNLQAQPVQQYAAPQQPVYTQSQPAAPQQATGGWKCACGTEVAGNFCPNCGSKKPEPVVSGSWTCSCGKTNSGNFCSECGSKRPVEKKKLVCDKCGWTGEDVNTRFCPNCGDPVTESDWQ